MKNRHIALMLCVLFLSTLFLGIGYATRTTTLSIAGEESLSPPSEVYISSVTPSSSVGVSVKSRSGLLLMMRVFASGTATFSITVTNPTAQTYVYERTIDGAEVGIEGVYTGTAITHMTEDIVSLEELAPGTSKTFTVRIAVPKNVTAEHYALFFNFLPKGSSDILPDGTKYEITFKPNNGDADQTMFVEKDHLIPPPADPVRDGYTFTGWYKDPTSLSPWNFATEKVSANTILYAGWQSNEVIPDPEPPTPPETVQYEVVFEYYNGDPDLTILVDEGALVPKPADPVRDGYTFTGWYKDVDCTALWNFETDTVTFSIMLHAGWRDNQSDVDPNLKGDFAGLVTVVLNKETNNGLNNSSVIYNAVKSAMDSNKRPNGHAPILHCTVNSISGGTMSDVAESANAKLTEELQFFFEGDPNDDNRLFLYMYYAKDCTADNVGNSIRVFKQVLVCDSDGAWKENGTYAGTATVGYFFGGGNNGKSVLTVDAYSWKAGDLPQT